MLVVISFKELKEIQHPYGLDKFLKSALILLKRKQRISNLIGKE